MLPFSPTNPPQAPAGAAIAIATVGTATARAIRDTTRPNPCDMRPSKSFGTTGSDDARRRPVPRNSGSCNPVRALLLGDAVVRDVGREGRTHVRLVEPEVAERVGVHPVLGLGLGV